MLTLDKLKAMKPDEIFAKGETLMLHPWFNNTVMTCLNKGGEPEAKGRYCKVKWVAIRGGIHDWAIYHSLDSNLEKADYLDGFSHLERSWEDIARHGAKMRYTDIIKKLVDPDEEAMSWYRD